MNDEINSCETINAQAENMGFDIDSYETNKAIRTSKNKLVIGAIIGATYLVLAVVSVIVAAIIPPLIGLIVFAISIPLELGVCTASIIMFLLSLTTICKSISKQKRNNSNYTGSLSYKTSRRIQLGSVAGLIVTSLILSTNIVEFILAVF